MTTTYRGRRGLCGDIARRCAARRRQRRRRRRRGGRRGELDADEDVQESVPRILENEKPVANDDGGGYGGSEERRASNR